MLQLTKKDSIQCVSVGADQLGGLWEKLLYQITSMSSVTNDIVGVNNVQSVVKDALESEGFSVKLVANPDGEHLSGNLVVGELPGNSSKYITLLCHADTVFPFDGIFSEVKNDENILYGSGIVDNKGGIIVGLRSLSLLSKPGKYGVRFICSPNEEVGSTGFHQIFEQYSKDSIAVLGLEPSLNSGDVISKRKGNRWYDIKVKGRQAHSGRDHVKGINACGELAIHLAKLHEMTDYSKNITVNIGKIEGGKNHNVVSDHAYGQLEVRYDCHESQQYIVKKIEQSLEKSFISSEETGDKCTLSYSVVDNCPPMSEAKGAGLLFEEYQKFIKSIENKTISKKCVGGAADANHFGRPNLAMLDGLGPIGGGMHTKDEFIILRSIETRAKALALLISEIQKGILEDEYN